MSTLASIPYTFTNYHPGQAPQPILADQLNANFAALLAASSTTTTLALEIAGDTQLTLSEANNLGFEFTGTLTGTATITWPAYVGILIVSNGTTGGFNISCGVLGGTFVTVLNGEIAPLWSNGTDVYRLTPPGVDLSGITDQNILAWAQQYYQNQGYVARQGGHNVLWADQNNVIGASNLTLVSGDQSLLTIITVTSPVSGDTISTHWTGPDGETYTDSYTLVTAATFTETIAGTTLTVGSPSGVVKVGDIVAGTNLAVIAQLTGPTGGAGTYELSGSDTIGPVAGSTIACPVLGLGIAFMSDGALQTVLNNYKPTNPLTGGVGYGYNPIQAIAPYVTGPSPADIAAGVFVQIRDSGGAGFPYNQLAFDQPWSPGFPSGGNVTVSSSGSTGITVGSRGGGTYTLDGGCQLQLGRFVPGRTPVTGDLGPWIALQASATGVSLDTQIGSVYTEYTSPTDCRLGFSSLVDGAVNIPIFFGGGVYGPHQSDPGLGNITMELFQCSGSLSGFQGQDRTTTGDFVLFRDTGSTFLFDSANGTVATWEAGMQLGSPSGGDKGAGTLNLESGGLYNSGTAPTGTGGGYVLAVSPTLATPIFSASAANAAVFISTGSGQAFIEVESTSSTALFGLNGTTTFIQNGSLTGTIALQVTGGGDADMTAKGATLSAGLTIGSSTLVTTTVALTNGAASATGSLTNAPTAGNPTKWIPINDNGTTRYIPAW